MKHILFIFSIFISLSLAAQYDIYQKKLDRLAQETAIALKRYGHPAVAVYPFYQTPGKITDASRIISEDFSIALDKYRERFKIIDRSYMEQMMEEHQLNAEGLIDPRTAKKFGMIIAADYYITGTITLFKRALRISVFAINTETGERIYSGVTLVPLSAELSTLLGISDWETLPPCEKHYTGTACFINRSNMAFRVKVRSNDGNHYDISIAPGGKNCLENLPADRTYRYEGIKAQVFIGDVMPEGQFYLRKCEEVNIRL